MRDLLVIVPSRGRPHNMRRLWRCWQATTQGDTWLEAGLDTDDPTKDGYPSGPGYVIQPGLQHKVTGWINYLAQMAPRQFRAVGMLGDDCAPRTEGWDTAIMGALEKTPFAFCNDLEVTERPPGTLATHIFMRTGVVERLGYFAPPSLQHMWIDLAWTTWGRACGITYLPDVIIEHLHFLGGKAPMDESYQRSRAMLDDDWLALKAYVADGRMGADIHKIDPSLPPFTEDDFTRVHRESGLWA